MDLNQKIIAALLAGFFIIALLRVFSAPLKLAVKLLVNTLLGESHRRSDRNRPGSKCIQRPGDWDIGAARIFAFAVGAVGNLDT